MSFSPINALSPLDGRYVGKLAILRPLMSEQGYMHRRVQVEIAWFIALSDARFAEFKPLSPDARQGKQRPEWINEVLAARDRDAAAPTFSPAGLYFLGRPSA